MLKNVGQIAISFLFIVDTSITNILFFSFFLFFFKFLAIFKFFLTVIQQYAEYDRNVKAPSKYTALIIYPGFFLKQTLLLPYTI